MDTDQSSHREQDLKCYRTEILCTGCGSLKGKKSAALEVWACYWGNWSSLFGFLVLFLKELDIFLKKNGLRRKLQDIISVWEKNNKAGKLEILAAAKRREVKQRKRARPFPVMVQSSRFAQQWKSISSYAEEEERDFRRREKSQSIRGSLLRFFSQWLKEKYRTYKTKRKSYIFGSLNSENKVGLTVLPWG